MADLILSHIIDIGSLFVDGDGLPRSALALSVAAVCHSLAALVNAY